MKADQLILRLKAEHNLTSEQIGKNIGRCRQMVDLYEKGKEPPKKIIVRLNNLYRSTKKTAAEAA